MKTHYQKWIYGPDAARSQWKLEGLTPNKVKFCDDLMLKKSRALDFVKDTDYVECKRCLKKIKLWAENGFDLPYTGS